MAYKDPPKETQFKKGQSGNPAGKPAGVENSKTRLARLLSVAMKGVDPFSGEEVNSSLMEQMDAAIIAKAIKGDVKAYQEVMDRIEGKAKQSIELQAEVSQLEITRRVIGAKKD